ncbi:MAG: hypothetical protein KDA69_10150 [Planctomycetaceae bacterium]|nr:hypothetical protein [Planctomycetaceae bacterium]MCA9044671.1 hypothetical protein [Planctomycetaceae bacterium]
MPLNELPPQQLALSEEIRAFDVARADEVEAKHQLLIEYLHLKGLDALLLQSPEMFRWLTAGASNQRLDGRTFAALFITREARVVLCSQVDSPQLFDRDLNGFGFLLKERPWTDDPESLRQDCLRTRRVGSDIWYPGAVNVGGELVDFRLKLTAREQQLAREVGAQLTHAVEATGRTVSRGESELEIMGQLSHRLLKHGIRPVQLQILADGRTQRYRSWTAGPDAVNDHCTLVAVGERAGIHVGVARTISFGAPNASLQDPFDIATLLQATGIHFSMVGWRFEETWRRVERIYEKFGVPDEWRLAEQGEFLGCGPCEQRFTPRCNREIPSDALLCWHPSVRSGLVMDTCLIHAAGPEVVTPAMNWPTVSVRVKTKEITLPAILIREQS